MTPRQEALKAYLISMMADGTFAGIRSPATLLRKASSVFAGDVPAVLGSLLNNAAESGMRNLGVMAAAKAEDLARDIATRGIRSLWSELNAQYDRGAARKKRR